MQYRELGTTGMRVSRLCFGTMTFGAEAPVEMARLLFHRCEEEGINFLDTANIYADGIGEEIIGDLLKGRRSDWLVATKARYPVGKKGPNERGASRRHLMLEIENSLRRLQTDWIDVYYIHGFDEQTALDETFRALDDAVSAGKILTIGVSNFAAWQVMKAAGLCARHGWSPIQVIQPMYSLLKRQAEVELLPMARSESIGVMPYSPLGGGMLTGKYLPHLGGDGDEEDQDTRFKQRTRYAIRYSEGWYADTARDFVDLAQELEVNPAALAIAWVMAHPAVTAPLIGARNLQQLEQCLEALSIPMDDELYNKISALAPSPPPATDRLEEQLPG